MTKRQPVQFWSDGEKNLYCLSTDGIVWVLSNHQGEGGEGWLRTMIGELPQDQKTINTPPIPKDER